MPYPELQKLAPFLASAGLPGFLCATAVMLTAHRRDFLAHETLEDALIFIKALRTLPVPPNLLFSCQLLLPRARDHSEGSEST